MDTLDLKKELGFLLKPPSRQPEIVDVPELPFLMVDGEGDPNQDPFKQAVSALYSAAYTLKFAVKKTRNLDYPVMQLEAMWWMADGATVSFTVREGWRWTAMIVLPAIVTQEDVRAALAAAVKKKPNPALDRIRMERFHEGRVAQILYIGPYSGEPPVLDALHEWVTSQGLRLHGKHHELYLSDPSRTAPERLKTILRHPVEG